MTEPHVVSDYQLRQWVNQAGYRVMDNSTGQDSPYFLLAKCLRHRFEENSLEKLWTETVPWGNKTFPQSTPESIAEHLLSEAEELVRDPYDTEEMADIAILLGHLVGRLGVELTAVARKKFEVNQKREWGKPNEKGFVEHVRQEGEEKKEKKSTIEVDALWDETVYEIAKGAKTGRVGKVTFYSIGGRTFVKEPVWINEPQTTEMRPMRESD